MHHCNKYKRMLKPSQNPLRGRPNLLKREFNMHNLYEHPGLDVHNRN